MHKGSEGKTEAAGIVSEEKQPAITDENETDIRGLIDMNFIEKINFDLLTELLVNTKKRIRLAVPSIQVGLSDVLIEAQKNGVSDIEIVIDNSEDRIRNGYGDVEEIEQLREKGISISECSGNQLSFIIADDIGFYIFPESKFYSDDPDGWNAVMMEPTSIVRIISNFFPPKNNSEHAKMREELEDAIGKIHNTIELATNEIQERIGAAQVKSLDAKRFNEIKKSIQMRPALNPDLSRQLNVYTSKIQFVELNFEGANISAARVHIPQEVLPFENTELKQVLQTRMELFSGLKQKKEFQEFMKLKERVDTLRKEFLKPIASRNKNILLLSRNKEFQREVDDIADEVKSMNETLPEFLQKEIDSRRETIQNALYSFYKKNPPSFMEMHPTNRHSAKLKEYVDYVISRIEFPNPADMVAKMKFTVNHYDVTYMDFNDEEFLKELVAKGIFDGRDKEKIISINEAFVATDKVKGDLFSKMKS